MASFLAYSQDELRLPWIIVVATIAATIGENLGFALGILRRTAVAHALPMFFRIRQTTLENGEQLFARYGAPTVFIARFVFGMRIIAGTPGRRLRMPWKKFMVFNFLGARVWVSVISAAGYLFGRHWDELEVYIKRFDVFIAVAAVVAIAMIWWRHRRRPARHLASNLC